jgi:hypothetical protein
MDPSDDDLEQRADESFSGLPRTTAIYCFLRVGEMRV